MVKNFMKVMALVLALCSLCNIAYAAEITDESSAETLVTYGVETEYLVIIPESVRIDTETGTGQMEVSVQSALLPSDKALVLMYGSAGGCEHPDELSDCYSFLTGKNSGEKLPYYIGIGNYHFCCAEPLIRWVSGETQAKYQTIDLTIIGTPKHADVFTGQLDFVVYLEEACTKCGESGSYTLPGCTCGGCERCCICEICYMCYTAKAPGTVHDCPGCGECMYNSTKCVYCSICWACGASVNFDETDCSCSGSLISFQIDGGTYYTLAGDAWTPGILNRLNMPGVGDWYINEDNMLCAEAYGTIITLVTYESGVIVPNDTIQAVHYYTRPIDQS